MRCQALLVEWLSKPEKGSKGAKEVEGTYLGWICSDESPIHNTNTDFWDFSSLPVRHWCRWHRSGDDLQPPAKPSTASHRRQLVAVAPAAGVYVDSVLEQAWEWWRALALRPGLGVCHYPISIVQCPVSMTEYFFYCLVSSFQYFQEHLHLMGIPQFKEHSDPLTPCPVFSFVPPTTVQKRLAGNVSCPANKTINHHLQRELFFGTM